MEPPTRKGLSQPVADHGKLGPDEFDGVLDMLLSGKVDVTPMVSHQFDFAEFDQALATAQQPDQAAKVVVTF